MVLTGKELILHKVAGAATYGGSASAVLFGLTANEVAALGVLLVAFIGVIAQISINCYFKSRHLRIAERLADLERIILKNER